MSRRAIVQIGTEKTGTTTLQHFLASNRAALRRNGFQYPEFCGALNHTGLAAYAMAPGRRDEIRVPFGIRAADDVEPMRARLRAAAAQELDPVCTALFCSEHCHSRLTTAAEVESLRGFLLEHFDEVRIAVYLRRQDQVALSLYSTRLKSGATDQRILPTCGPDDPYFNYDRFLSLWENAFGRENVSVRLFERGALVGGDVVSDVVAAWGLGDLAAYRAVAPQNPSINAVAQDFLRRVNGHLPAVPGVPVDEVRGPLAARLAALLPGRGARPSRQEARAFYDRFAAANEAVRSRHFPTAPTLFDESFSDYPESADQLSFDAEDIATVAAQLHAASIRESRRLEAEIAMRDARLHWQREETEAALGALRRALRWTPESADVQRMLAEYLLRLDRLAEALAAASAAVERRPASSEFWHFLGIVRRRLGDLDGAADAQTETLARAPDHAGARTELALIAARVKERAAGRRDGPDAARA